MEALRLLSKKSKPLSEIEIEIEALRQDHANQSKGTWADVFSKKNRTRTGVAVLAMFGQQITGQAFVSQYSVIFYQQQGFQNEAFFFAVMTNVAALICLLITWSTVDTLGRRCVNLSFP